MAEEQLDIDPEIEAIGRVYKALKELDGASQTRVLQYVAQKLSVSMTPAETEIDSRNDRQEDHDQNRRQVTDGPQDKVDHTEDDDLEGISVIARKWMKRNGLDASSISKLFSLGIDDIDLVAKSVPGDNKKRKMQNVFLLKGVAAYLGSGAARFAHDSVRETSIHYDAWDTNNFARYFAEFAAEISGSKDAGYTLTSRGLTAAAELIKEMVGAKS